MNRSVHTDDEHGGVFFLVMHEPPLSCMRLHGTRSVVLHLLTPPHPQAITFNTHCGVD